MNERKHDRTLKETAAETVESLAMIFLVEPDEAPQAGGPRRAARVAFTGPFDGTVELAVDDAVAVELAANMLGEFEAKTTRSQQDDAVKELLNVICGNLLPAVAGPEPVFHLSVPELIEPATCAAGESGPTPAGTARLFTEYGSLDVRLFLRKPSTVSA